MLNYKQLHYFWKVAKTGSIARAAEQLRLAPQTISAQIGTLEEALGTELFRRVGRRLELTATGQLTLSYADEIFQIGRELEETVRNRPGRGAMLFRVGVADFVPKSIAYRLLAPALDGTESVRLICREDKLERLFAELAIHKVDLVLADRPLPSELGVKGYSHALGRTPIAFYAVPGLARRCRENFPQSLDGAPMLIPSEGATVREALTRWFSKHQIEPRIVGEFDDTALMKAFGKAGTGVFPAPAVLAEEIRGQYNTEIIDCADGVAAMYYAISIERKLTHPAVVAISEAAKKDLVIDDRDFASS
ncbi:LysR family transcriptional regulator [Devosia geojensis]|uniref:LysR family transcriptional regulator n=1 Tax=Devosia geojensis TaxID=443610 RepID=A0A0F5FG26_9HYPH|nr:LysR family transcriptional regulator [Devosia geojensis]